MEDFFQELLKQALSEKDEKRAKMEVGKLDDELLMMHKEMKKEKQRIEDEAEIKVRELELRQKREREDLIEPYQEKIHIAHHKFWNKVQEKNNLPTDGDYNINLKEKKVYEYIDDVEPTNRWMN